VGATLGDFVSRNAHSLIIGAVLGALPLGYYAMAYQIIRVPDLVISGPLYLLIFSTVAQAARGQVGAARRPRSPWPPCGWPRPGWRRCSHGLGLTAGLAVAVVLGPKWLDASTTLAWLCAAGLGFSLRRWSHATLMGLGRSGLQFRLALALGGATVAAVAVAAPFGVAVVGAAVAVGHDPDDRGLPRRPGARAQPVRADLVRAPGPGGGAARRRWRL
jgi:PST family polysaccharide transporter